MRRLIRNAVLGFAGAVALFAAPRASQAVLTVTIAPASGVDLSHLTVGQTFDVDVIFQTNDAFETVTRINGIVAGSLPNLKVDSITTNPALFTTVPTTPLVGQVAEFTVNAPGSGSFYGDFNLNQNGGYFVETNEKSSYFFNTNTLTYNATATAVPEPVTAGLFAVGAAGVLGRRRRRGAATA